MGGGTKVPEFEDTVSVRPSHTAPRRQHTNAESHQEIRYVVSPASLGTQLHDTALCLGKYGYFFKYLVIHMTKR